MKHDVHTVVHQTLSGLAPATRMTTAATSPAPTHEDCARLTLIRFSSVGRGPTLPTEVSVQLDLESGTTWGQTSGSRWRRFYLVSAAKAPFESTFNCALEILLLTYL